MTASREEIAAAAFWDEYICLDCGNRTAFKLVGGACPECNGTDVHEGKFIQRLVEILVEGDAS